METRIAAHYIFPLTSDPIKNGILVLDNQGMVIDLIDNKGELRESARLSFYSGILIPALPQLTIHSLRDRQQQMPHLSLQKLISTFSDSPDQDFIVGNKVGVLLLSGLDMKQLSLTPQSKLKKLV